MGAWRTDIIRNDRKEAIKTLSVTDVSYLNSQFEYVKRYGVFYAHGQVAIWRFG